MIVFFFFFSSRRRHTRWTGDWSSDVCSSDLDIRESGELIDAETAARREGWHEHLVAGVKTVDRPGEVEAVRQGGDRHLRRKRLASRNAVLIDDGQPDGAQVKVAYPARDRIRRHGLLGGVQTMAGHEAMLANPVDQAAAGLIRCGVSHLANLRSGTARRGSRSGPLPTLAADHDIEHRGGEI